MKLSTAGKCVCMSYFLVPGAHKLLDTATRVVYVGQTRRFLFPDGSVLESNKGQWKEMKSPKLEAAMRRFGNDQKLPIAPFDQAEAVRKFQDMSDECFCIEHGLHIEQLKKERDALQELLNEKDEQLDKASRPMVVRFDWWAVILCGLMLFARFGLDLS